MAIDPNRDTHIRQMAWNIAITPFCVVGKIFKVAIYCTPIIGEFSRIEQRILRKKIEKLDNEAPSIENFKKLEALYKKEILISSCKIVRKIFHIAFAILISATVFIPPFEPASLSVLAVTIPIICWELSNIHDEIKSINYNRALINLQKAGIRANDHCHTLEERAAYLAPYAEALREAARA